jgi:hypothetical protein
MIAKESIHFQKIQQMKKNMYQIYLGQQSFVASTFINGACDNFAFLRVTSVFNKNNLEIFSIS